ncbi:MAG: hypothetical protein IKB43_11415 [Fibrobacter sp.]|nr:hypothetical protein [Fibrobacter sp.]
MNEAKRGVYDTGTESARETHKKSRANKFALPIILRITATKKVTQKNLSELTRVFNRLLLRKREASAALPKFIFASF